VFVSVGETKEATTTLEKFFIRVASPIIIFTVNDGTTGKSGERTPPHHRRPVHVVSCPVSATTVLQSNTTAKCGSDTGNKNHFKLFRQSSERSRAVEQKRIPFGSVPQFCCLKCMIREQGG
jgi:hypothetical protein